MADDDQTRWDRRYAQGDHPAQQPSEFLLAMLAQTPGPGAGALAADLACGRGRNTRALAAAGFHVHGYDVSPVGLAAAAAATSPDLARRIAWRHRDLLEAGLPVSPRYHFVLISRFVAPDLLKVLHQHVVTGGYLCIEEHLAVPAGDADWQALVAAAAWPDGALQPGAIAGPGSGRFRVPAGALREAVAGHFEILHDFEGLVADREGKPALLAQLFARRPGG